MDDHYRYKMKMPQIGWQKKKGRDVTLFTNLAECAQGLQIAEEFTIKIISSKLSCKGSIDKVMKCGALTGHYPKETIVAILLEFIRGYLLCAECDRPEVDMCIRKDQIKHKCRACGDKRYVPYDTTNPVLYDTIVRLMK